MIKIRTFSYNEKGKIEFTKEGLQKLLNEVYNEGIADNCSIYYGSSTICSTSDIASKVSTSIDKNNIIIKDY